MPCTQYSYIISVRLLIIDKMPSMLPITNSHFSLEMLIFFIKVISIMTRHTPAS